MKSSLNFEKDAIVDLRGLFNRLRSFEREYTSIFESGKYISVQTKKRILESYRPYFELLSAPEFLEGIEKRFDKAEQTDVIKKFLYRYSSLNYSSKLHNDNVVDEIIFTKRDYFDKILEDVDKNIRLDDDQRRAIVVDEDNCLLVAGAGSGKTTTIVAKVKYLVEEKNIDPGDILVISFTNKAVSELEKRINTIPKLSDVKISTFHAFGFRIIRNSGCSCPDVSIRDGGGIAGAINLAIAHDKSLMKKMVLFFGYYFDLPDDVFEYDSLDTYHKIKAREKLETLRSNLGEYNQKIGDERSAKYGTITGEYLRSVQEAQIANFLYLNGIEYQYERPYPHKMPFKKYTPDFFIVQGDKEAYLEHYGLSESGTNDRFTIEEIEKYKKSITSKRELHEKYKTKLMETWSSYNDGLPLLDHLKDVLEDNGFILKPRDPMTVYSKIVNTSKDRYVSRFAIFVERFIKLFKTCGYGLEEFSKMREITKNQRSLAFLNIVEKIYSEYQISLEKENKIDFADMINDACSHIDELKKQNITLPFKYIIIDEFQDIAEQRFNLIQKIHEISDSKIIAVGDDWQSIYAFAGSKINLFTDFLEKIGEGVELKIKNTYRNSQELIDIAGNFVQKNSLQIKKKLVSEKHVEEPILIRSYDDSKNPLRSKAKTIVDTIGEIVDEFGIEGSILLLGRYNFDVDNLTKTEYFLKKNDKIICNQHPDANLTFMTIHRSKGLGYDNVILINMSDGKFGFPCQIEDDPLMKFVMHDDASVEFSEERRLFYVALTRTKNKVYLITPIRRPSRFLVELIEDFGLPQPKRLELKIADSISIRCPVCNYPLKMEFNKNYERRLYICTNEPEVCDFITNDPEYKHDILKCPECDDGYLIVKRNGEDGSPFYGCTNYDDRDIVCKTTMRIEQNVQK